MTDLPPAPEPPSNYRPFVLFGLVTAFAVLGGLGAWASFARLDSAVMAPGMVAAETNRKTIQHLEGGIVDEILVRDWQVVQAGDVLMKLKPVQAEATALANRLALDAALALEARLLAEQNDAKEITFPADILARKKDPQTAALIADQQVQFERRTKSLTAQVSILESRIDQAKQQIGGLEAQAISTQMQLKSMDEEYKKLSELNKKSYFPLNRLMEMQRRRDEQWSRHEQIKADLAKTSDVIRENELQILQLRSKFKEEVAQGQREVRLQINELTEKLRVSKDVLSRLLIRAPEAGMVQGLKVHSPGAVLRPGDAIMELAPLEDVLIVQTRIAPVDINYVTVGRTAEVRFPGVKDRTIAMVLGTVRTVSADVSIDDKTREPFYAASVEVKQADLPAALKGKLRAGMPTDVIIATGERTVAYYLTAPIYDAVTKTMREH
jgi:HlyD family type I secretion membrane fusion protein